jgi:hypothetical protein
MTAQSSAGVRFWQFMTVLALGVASAALALAWKTSDPRALRVSSLELVGASGESIVLSVRDTAADGYSELRIVQVGSVEEDDPSIALSLSKTGKSAFVSAKAGNYHAFHQSFAQLEARPGDAAVSAEAQYSNATLHSIAHTPMGSASLDLSNAARTPDGQLAPGAHGGRAQVSLNGSRASVLHEGEDARQTSAELVALPR